jgi:hypothetical protein
VDDEGERLRGSARDHRLGSIATLRDPSADLERLEGAAYGQRPFFAPGHPLGDQSRTATTTEDPGAAPLTCRER